MEHFDNYQKLPRLSRARSPEQLRKMGIALQKDEPSQEEYVSQKELTAALPKLFARLAPKQRELMEYRYIDGLSDADIAKRCGISLGSVRSTMRAAEARLRVFALSLKDHVDEADLDRLRRKRGAN